MATRACNFGTGVTPVPTRGAAAAQAVDVTHYLQTGEALLKPSAFELAGDYGGMNSDYLAPYKIYLRISNISVNLGQRLVVVIWPLRPASWCHSLG